MYRNMFWGLVPTDRYVDRHGDRADPPVLPKRLANNFAQTIRMAFHCHHALNIQNTESWQDHFQSPGKNNATPPCMIAVSSHAQSDLPWQRALNVSRESIRGKLAKRESSTLLGKVLWACVTGVPHRRPVYRNIITATSRRECRCFCCCCVLINSTVPINSVVQSASNIGVDVGNSKQSPFFWKTGSWNSSQCVMETQTPKIDSGMRVENKTNASNRRPVLRPNNGRLKRTDRLKL